MFWENYSYLCGKAGKSPNAVAAECGVKSTGTVSSWKKGTVPYTKTLEAIARYFDVTIEDLTGPFIPTKEKEPDATDGKSVDDELKVALFGGSGDVTDAMWDEVKQFAQMVKLREDQKKKG